MAIHFTREEFDTRRDAAVAAMTSRGLDALLMFRQESMYYLTGFDTFGFCFFQCLVLTAEGRLTLLTRAPDLRQAQHTSILEDIRVWTDAAGHNPAGDLRGILDEHGLEGRKLGVEYDAYGLTAYNGRRLES
ncbi:MAG TPA: aminopeptidase P family N-terminal domain-containing protein, partial [Gammaproteobacteria bacterium]|nr:aminopeptidase P family N-terminal domain-containing protein [Gammaproteobacteria bacterium]